MVCSISYYDVMNNRQPLTMNLKTSVNLSFIKYLKWCFFAGTGIGSSLLYFLQVVSVLFISKPV